MRMRESESAGIRKGRNEGREEREGDRRIRGGGMGRIVRCFAAQTMIGT